MSTLDELIEQAQVEQKKLDELEAIEVTRERIVRLVGEDIFNYEAKIEEDRVLLSDGATGWMWLITIHYDQGEDLLIVSYEPNVNAGVRNSSIEVDTSGDFLLERRRAFLDALGRSRDQAKN